MKSVEIILVLAGVILTVVTTYSWNKINLVGRITLVVLILGGVFVAINSFRSSRKEDLIEKINSKFGDIDVKNLAESKFKLGYKENSAHIKLMGGIFKLPESEKPIIKLNIVNDKLLINVVIRNFKGKAIAVIDDNTWTVYDDDYEYNNDDTSFELVTKGDRNVFFQIFYRNEMIYMSGYLIDENGVGVAMFNNNSNINSSQMYLNGMKDKVNKIPSPMPSPSDIAIPRIFKYPREKYYSKKL